MGWNVGLLRISNSSKLTLAYIYKSCSQIYSDGIYTSIKEVKIHIPQVSLRPGPGLVFDTVTTDVFQNITVSRGTTESKSMTRSALCNTSLSEILTILAQSEKQGSQLRRLWWFEANEMGPEIRQDNQMLVSIVGV